MQIAQPEIVGERSDERVLVRPLLWEKVQPEQAYEHQPGGRRALRHDGAEVQFFPAGPHLARCGRRNSGLMSAAIDRRLSV